MRRARPRDIGGDTEAAWGGRSAAPHHAVWRERVSGLVLLSLGIAAAFIGASLEEASRAYQKMMANEVRFRAVLVN